MKKPVLRIDVSSGEKVLTSELYRVVKTKSGNFFVDVDHNIEGRGGYIKKDKGSILLAKKKNSLSRTLRGKVPEEIYDQLLRLLEEGR